MELNKTYSRGIAVVEIRGKLVGGLDNSETFDHIFAPLFAEGPKRIVVNLAGVPWASSQGIGMLIGAYIEAKRAGGQLVLAEVGTRIRDLFTVTRLFQVFETFETVEQAVDFLADPQSQHTELPLPQPVVQHSLETDPQ